MSIVIFGDLFSFPEGQAATNRVYTYAKGFNENGVKTSVVCFSSEYLDTPDGIADGIPYYHPFNQKKRSNNFLVRRWRNFLKYINTYKVLRKINKEDKIIAINTWSNLFFTHFIAWIYARLLGTKIITECSEHPLRNFQGSKSQLKKGNTKLYWEVKLCDGILCISQYLVDLYLEKGVNPKKLFLVPSTVDPSRFIIAGSKPLPQQYVGYFGSLTYKRDSVDILIKAFSKFSATHPDIKLVLGGFCSENQKQQLHDLFAQLNITSNVQLLQYLSRQEILSYITHADVLVMARSKDLESDASYPSKLTEFLATGKPVISFNVGEIANYITDNEQAFLVGPTDIDGLAAKLDLIFNNYEAAIQVGKKGKELTSNVFHYNFQAKRIIEYVHTL